MNDNKKISLGEIAEKFNFSIFGDSDICISSVGYCHYADENTLAVAKRRIDIEKSRSKAVLTKPVLCQTDKTLMYAACDDIECEMAKVAAFLVEKGIYKDYRKAVEYTQTNGGYSIGKNCVIGNNTMIEPYAVIGENVHIGDNCIIGSGAYIGSDCKIGNNVIIKSGAKICSMPSYHNMYDNRLESFAGAAAVILDDDTEIGCNSIVQRGVFRNTVIGKGSKIDDLTIIGHDTIIGTHSRIVSQAGLASDVVVGNYVVISGQVGVSNRIEIGDNAYITGSANLRKNVEKGKTICGFYGLERDEDMRIFTAVKKLSKKKNK